VAENNALISCERGARTSREAAGIHYHLGQARNDPTNTIPASSFGYHLVGPAIAEEEVAGSPALASSIVLGEPDLEVIEHAAEGHMAGTSDVEMFVEQALAVDVTADVAVEVAAADSHCLKEDDRCWMAMRASARTCAA